MKHVIVTITILATLAGCNYLAPDPCVPGALFDSLTPEQQGSCDECGDAYGCEGETGEEQALGIFTCYHDYTGSTAEVCWDGDRMDEIMGAVGTTLGFYTKHSAQCVTVAGPFACNRHWSDPEGLLPFAGNAILEPHECYLCRPDQAGNDAKVQAPNLDPDGWRLCDDFGGPQNNQLATILSQDELDALVQHSQMSSWQDAIGCVGEPIATCQPVQLYGTDSSWAAPGPQLWRCRCEADEDCPDGQKCAAGWIVDGDHPRPSVCTHPDETVNGDAPDGPEAYMISEWAEGLTVEGDEITVTPGFYLALYAGVLNDDQSFGLVGDLTHVGPSSLAAHLDLEVGDIVQAEQRHATVMEAGGVAEIPVVREGVVYRVLRARIEQ